MPLLGLSSLALRNVSRHRRSSAVALCSIMLGVVAIVLAGGFIEWIYFAMREDVIHSQLGHIQVTRPGYFERGVADPSAYLLPAHAAALREIESFPHVTEVAPRLSFTGLVSQGDATISFLGEGIVPQREVALSRTVTILRGRGLSEDDATGIILGEGLASNLGVDVGARVVLIAASGTGAINGTDAHVRGIFSTVSKSYDDTALRATLPLAQQLARTDGTTRWVILLDKTANTAAVVKAMRRKFAGQELEFTPWSDLSDFYNKTVVLFGRQVGVMKFLIALIVVLSISNTLMRNVLERAGEIGTSMALGTNARTIMLQFLLEAMLLGVVGAAAGLALGGAAAALISSVGIPMPPPPGMARGFTAQILVTPDLARDAAVLALVTTLLAGLYPAWKASRLNIVDALRHFR